MRDDAEATVDSKNYRITLYIVGWVVNHLANTSRAFMTLDVNI